MNPAISQPTSDAITASLAKNPADRFQSYDEFIMALTTAQTQLMVQKYAATAAVSGNDEPFTRQSIPNGKANP